MTTSPIKHRFHTRLQLPASAAPCRQWVRALVASPSHPKRNPDSGPGSQSQPSPSGAPCQCSPSQAVGEGSRGWPQSPSEESGLRSQLPVTAQLNPGDHGQPGVNQQKGALSQSASQIRNKQKHPNGHSYKVDRPTNGQWKNCAISLLQGNTDESTSSPMCQDGYCKKCSQDEEMTKVPVRTPLSGLVNRYTSRKTA